MSSVGGFLQVYSSLILLFGAVVTDLRSGRIRNVWIIAGIGAGVILLGIPGSGMTPQSFFCGMAAPILICWIPFRMRAIGAGDVKLFLALGCINGGEDVLYCIFLAFLIAAGFSLSKLLSLGQLNSSLKNCFQYFVKLFVEKRIETYPGSQEKSHTMHFAVTIFLGYVAWLGVKVCNSVSLL